MSGQAWKEDARLDEFQRDYAAQLEDKDAELDRACRLLFGIEGTILAYWTDIPETLLERHRVELREFLGDWGPSATPGASATVTDKASGPGEVDAVSYANNIISAPDGWTPNYTRAELLPMARAYIEACVGALDLHKAEIQRLRELVCECGRARDFEGGYVPADHHDPECPAVSS